MTDPISPAETAPTASAVEKPAPKLIWCLNGWRHCLHKSDNPHNRQVAGGVHMDQVCCWCGGVACRDELAFTRKGHGPFLQKDLRIKRYSTSAKKVLDIYNRASPRLTTLSFDTNEVDLARLFMAGLSVAEIKVALKLSPQSLAQRFAKIRKRLKVRTTVQAFMVIAKSISL